MKDNPLLQFREQVYQNFNKRVDGLKEWVGVEQLHQLLENTQMPFHDQLCVSVTDSSYGKPAYLYPQCRQTNLVQVTRVRRNRVFFHQPTPDPDQKARRSHP